MSQTTQSRGESNRPRRPRREPVEEVWVPKTILGQKVASGEITSLEEIIESGLRIQESGIIKKLHLFIKIQEIHYSKFWDVGGGAVFPKC